MASSVSGFLERFYLSDGSWSSKPFIWSIIDCPAAAIPHNNGFTSRPVYNEGLVDEADVVNPKTSSMVARRTTNWWAG